MHIPILDMEHSGVVSGAASGRDQREVRDVMEGNLVLEHHPLSKMIRIYISSELADSQWERAYLRERVLPRLRKYCHSLGIYFNAVDLHNDFPRGADCSEVMYQLESQGMLRLALEEVMLCQQVSAGVTFVTFLAQRYGHKPLCMHIHEEDFKLLCAAVEDPAAKQLIQKWYKLDSNAVSPEFVLQQPTESMIADQESFQQWIDVHDSLSKTIRKAAKVALGKDPAKVQKYTMSVIEEEVTCGIFNLKRDPNQCCFWFKRTFTDLLEQRMGDVALPKYTDVAPGRRGMEFDMEAMKTLNHLKEARMPAKYAGLDANNIFEFPIKWQKNTGLDPNLNSTHSQYLTSMCERFSSTLETKVAKTADLFQAQTSNDSVVYQEVLCHGAYCKEQVHTYMDRPGISSYIQSYIDGSSNQPLVIHGPSGSGKTSMMAAAAYRLRQKNPLKKMTIVLRFLGTTPHSSDIRHTLRSICEQITFVYREDPIKIPGDYKGIADHFASLLHNATAEKPLYIFLDAVDQLFPDDGASGMSWLPISLPPNVKITLSTSSEVQYRCYPVLQSLLAKQQKSFVEVPLLTPSECIKLLRHCLASKKRQLAPTQEEVALRVFGQCPLPLYLQFLMSSIVCWKSYTLALSWNQTLPPQDLKGVIGCLFSKLEDEHGCALVSHTLGYITAAKHGLTESELLDILTCDLEVMDEVSDSQGSDTTHLSAVPPLLWSQLYHGLTSFLKLRRGTGDALVLRWSHKSLQECASSHYLGSEEVLCTRSGMLADYFSGRLAVERESLTPASSNEGSTAMPPKTQFIDNQPLLLNEESQLYNIRKLTELPYCLAGCKRDKELKELLTDYDWLKASILTTSCADVISTFLPVLPVVPLGRHGSTDSMDSELRLLREALGYATDAFNSNPTPSQLCVQLIGRLLPYVQQSVQLERPLLKKLVMSAMVDATPPLIPLQPFLNIPGGPLLVSMEGHRDTVSCIAATTITTATGGWNTKEKLSLCIVSSSYDGSLKSWDLESTGVLKTFDGHTDKVLSVALSSDGQYAVSGSADTTVRHWDVPTGHCLHTMKGHTATVNAVVITSDGCKAVSGASDTAIKVWNTDPTSSSCGKVVFTMRNHKSPVLALALSGDVYLASGAKNGVALVTNIVSGEVLQTLKGHTGGVTALAMTEMEGCHYLLSGSEDCSIKVWGVETGNLLHTLTTNTEGERGPIRCVTAGPKGTVVASCGSKLVAVWSLQSGTHLFNLAGHTDITCCTTMVDEGSLAITGSADCSIRIWDLQSPPVSQTMFHQGDVLSVAISPCETYGISAGADATVKIYELDNMKLVGDIKGHSEGVNHVSVLRDSRQVLTASSDKTIQLWNGESGELLQTFKGHEARVNCVALSSDGELLMSGGEDGKVIFWGLKTGKMLKAFSNHPTGIISVAFAQSSSSYFMLSASRDGQLCIRDFYTAEVLLSTKAHTQEDMLCLAVSQNANFIATGSTDCTVNILSIPQGELKLVLSGHKKAVRSVKVLPDCERCLSASEDCTLRIWGITHGECLASLHMDVPVLSCDISCHMTILCGTTKGWVSTAFYQVHPNASTSPVMRNLLGIKSPSASSFADSLSSVSTNQMEPPLTNTDERGGTKVEYERLMVSGQGSDADNDNDTAAQPSNAILNEDNTTTHHTNNLQPPPYPIDAQVTIVYPHSKDPVSQNDELQLHKHVNSDTNGTVTKDYTLQLEKQLEGQADGKMSNRNTKAKENVTPQMESPKSSTCTVL